MNTKQLPLVTYEQSRRLCAVGFDWKTNSYYRPGNTIPVHSMRCLDFNECNGSINIAGCSSAPTVALARMWMRKEKSLYGFCDRNDTNWYLRIYKPDNSIKGCSIICYDGKEFDTYEAAESALLDELLTLLEKEKQQ